MKMQPSLPEVVNATEASDLTVAVAIMAASAQVPAPTTQDPVFYAGLGNDGRLRPVPDITDAATAVEAAAFCEWAS